MKSKFFLFLKALSLVACGLQATETAIQPSFQFESEREQDLNVILEEGILDRKHFDKIIAMFVEAAIVENKKDCSAADVVGRLHQEIDTLEVRREMMKSYENFSDEEVHQLRKIYEDPVSQKYTAAGMSIMQAQLEVLQNLISTVLEQEKDLPASSGEEQPDTIVILTKENFQAEVELATQPVIIDVYATWCGPCKALAPNFKAVSQRYQAACKFAKIDGDQQKELVERFGIQGYPTLLFMHQGKFISKEVGFMTQQNLEAKVQQFLESIQALKS